MVQNSPYSKIKTFFLPSNSLERNGYLETPRGSLNNIQKKILKKTTKQERNKTMLKNKTFFKDGCPLFKDGCYIKGADVSL